jgi:methyl-accepting chemotaxis protein
MPKMMSDMSNRMVGEMTNMVGEVNGKVGEITNIVGEMNGRMGEMSHTVNSHSQSIAKLKTQVRQMVNTLNKKEEGKLPSQLVVNPMGLYMVNEETSHHQ